MIRRIGRCLRIPFRRGEQVVFLHDTALPAGGSVPAGAVGEVIRELDDGDRLFVEVLREPAW